MELLCPQCQQKLTIADEFAGQVMRCPLCNGTFTAPALSAAPFPLLAIPPETSSAVLAGEPPLTSAAAPPPLPDLRERESAPPSPPGQYSRSLTLRLSLNVLRWVPPAGLLLLLLLSFFSWFPASFTPEGLRLSPNAWSAGFGENGDATIGVYLLVLLLALAASITSVLFGAKLLPAPPFIKSLGPWRPLIPGGLALLGLLLFLVPYLETVFAAARATLWFKLVARVQLVVVVAALLELWLEFRRRKKLPPPRVELHW